MRAPVERRARFRSDKELVAACRRGDPGAWETLVERYERLVYSIPAAFRLGHDADDVFQKVMIKLLDNLDRLHEEASLAAWLAVTARRECIDHLRARRRLSPIDEEEHPGPAAPPADVAADLDAVEREHALELALSRLDPPCRDLLRALYLEDPTPSYEQLAARLGRPIGSLGPSRARCLRKLRRFYVEIGGSAP